MPSSFVTLDGLRRHGWKQIPSGWLVESSRPLTSEQIAAARELAAEAGLAIETQRESTSLATPIAIATAAGALLALAILALTVGLIRSESAGDLRTLTATGATSRIRRTLTAATAGALALLGALLGVAGAYLALAATYHDDLGYLGRIPVLSLVLIVVGVPLIAAAAGWLLAGREPPAIARPPSSDPGQESARSSAARSVGAPCVGSTSSTGSSSSGRSASRICSIGTPLSAQSAGNSRPLPRSMSVSPATSARRLSTQSTRSFGSIPGNASTPTGSRSPALNTCPGDRVRVALVRRGHEQRRAEPLHQALGVAPVPRACQHDDRLAAGRELVDQARRSQRIEEQQPLAVVDRVGRDHLAPVRFRLPVRMRRLPVPHARLQLAHGGMLNAGDTGEVYAKSSRSRIFRASV